MNIRTKIPVGFGLMIMLVIGTAGLSWNAFHKLSISKDVVTEFQALQDEMLFTKSIADDFQSETNTDALKKVQAETKKLQVHIQRIKELDAFSDKLEQLDKIHAEISVFNTQFTDFFAQSTQALSLSKENATRAQNFRNEVILLAQSSHKKAIMLEKLIKKTDTQIANILKQNTPQKLSAVIKTATRIRAKVNSARDADLYAQQMVGYIYAIERAQMNSLKHAAQDDKTTKEIATLSKRIFMTGLKFKKVANSDAAPQIMKLLSNINLIRVSFNKTKEAEALKETALNQMITASNSIVQLVHQTVKDAKKEMDQTIAYNSDLILYSVVTALVAGIVIAFTISRSIVRPINQVIINMKALQEGDYSQEIDTKGRTDEIGRMLETAEIFRRNGLENDRLRNEIKDEEERTAQERRQALFSLADRLESRIGSIVGRIAASVEKVQVSSNELSETANKTGDDAAEVSTATQEASANVESVSSATTDLSKSIQDILEQAAQVSNRLQMGVKDVHLTNKSVQGLSQAAQTIGEVVNLIRDIAEKTNLLALNATIEAARAGDAGKGFSIVANEVKNLANQTGAATSQIEDQIKSIQDQTSISVKRIQDLNDLIGDIEKLSTSITSAVEQQNIATMSIAENIEMASSGTRSVSERIIDVSYAANATRSHSQSLLAVAAELETESQTLNEEIHNFLDEIRSE